jgi:hypothetical protein
MSSALEQWLGTAAKGADFPATDVEVKRLESLIGFGLPEQIRLVFLTANRAEGFVGKSYLAFFDVDDVVQWCNGPEYETGFIPFASNGGGEWYGLDSRQQPPKFVLMPAVGIAWSAAMCLGTHWETFWQSLQQGDLFSKPYQG